MNSRLTFIKRFSYSLNPKMYINLIGDKFIKAILYIFIISIIIGGFNGVSLVNLITTDQKDIESKLSTDEFDFIFRDGILDFKNSPYIEEGGQTLILIDTTKDMSEIDDLRSTTVHKDMSVILFRDGFIAKSGATQIEYPYTESIVSGVSLTNEDLLESMDMLASVKFIAIPASIVATFVDIMINAFIISTMGLVSTILNKQRVPYYIIFKLSMYAMTIPAIINFTFSSIYNVNIMIGGLILIFALHNILNNPTLLKKDI